jgi:hypothetical protein
VLQINRTIDCDGSDRDGGAITARRHATDRFHVGHRNKILYRYDIAAPVAAQDGSQGGSQGVTLAAAALQPAEGSRCRVVDRFGRSNRTKGSIGCPAERTHSCVINGDSNRRTQEYTMKIRFLAAAAALLLLGGAAQAMAQSNASASHAGQAAGSQVVAPSSRNDAPATPSSDASSFAMHSDDGGEG